MNDASDSNPDTYNIESYGRGVNSEYRRLFRSSGLRVGDPAPDVALWTTTGTETSVSSVRGEGHLFLVFGCWSAPPCLHEIGEIDRLAAEVTTNDRTRLAFVYTREIHPAEVLGPHRSLEGKCTRARDFADAVGLTMPVLVDDLAGTAHRAFGGLPFMAIGIAHDGAIVHRSEWAHVDGIRVVADNLALRDARRAEGRPGRVSYAENLWYMPSITREQIDEGLAVAGESALADAPSVPDPRCP